MKIIDCEQGTPQWVEARLGIPTASRFDKIITPKTLQLSKSADMLICQLIAEKLLGQFQDSEESDWMNRGSNLEDIAADDYAFSQDVDLKRVGFITTDDGLIGCSPDRLIVGRNAGLEIKNPSAHVHISYMLDPNSLFEKYKCQVLGSLWITRFDYWDLMSYHPYLPRVVVTCMSDDLYYDAVDKAMYDHGGFLDRYREASAKITTITQTKEIRDRLVRSA